MDKLDSAYKTIGEVAKILDLKSKKNTSNPTHTIRFWEKEFKQIKPKILNNKRRYYDNKNIELLKKFKKEIDEFPKNFQLIDEKKYGISKIIFGSYF